MRQAALVARLESGVLLGSLSDDVLEAMARAHLQVEAPQPFHCPVLGLLLAGRLWPTHRLSHVWRRAGLALALARIHLYGRADGAVIQLASEPADEREARSLLLAGWILSPDPGDEGAARRCPLTLARQMHVPVAFAAEWRDLAIQESEARRWWHGGSGWLRLLKEGAAIRVREYIPIQASTGAC